MLPGASRVVISPRCVWGRSICALLLLWLVGWVGGRASAQAQSRPDPRFGAVEAFWAPDEAARVQLGWERILFFWSEIQPTGPEDWNTLHVDDRWLARAQADGREVVGVIKQTPAWATDGLPAAGVPRGLYLPPSDPKNLWANFVRRIAAYYGPRGVHDWIIWNEPDIPPDVYGHEFSGSVVDYYRLVKVAYQVMRAADPEAVIHLAGLTYWHDALAGRPQYLQRFLETASADSEAPAHNYFFDVISLHVYFRVETIPSLIAAMNNIQAEFGLAKPVWLNETNAAPNLDPEWPTTRQMFSVDLEQQAWFVAQALALGLASGAERVEVYKFTDVLAQPGTEPFGLLRADLSPRPALTALATTIELLQGFTDVRSQPTETTHRLTFRLPGRFVRVLWARRAESVTLRLGAIAPMGEVVDVTGRTRPVAAEGGSYTLTLDSARCEADCLIGGPPLFLVERLPSSPTPTPTPTLTTPAPTTAPTATPRPTATAAAVISGQAEGENSAESLPPALPPTRLILVIAALISLAAVGLWRLFKEA